MVASALPVNDCCLAPGLHHQMHQLLESTKPRQRVLESVTFTDEPMTRLHHVSLTSFDSEF